MTTLETTAREQLRENFLLQQKLLRKNAASITAVVGVHPGRQTLTNQIVSARAL